MKNIYAITVAMVLIAAARGQTQDISSLSAADPQRQNSSSQSPAVPAGDGGLGSTMTMEQLGEKPAAVRAAENKLLVVRPMGESSPALRYRLWLPDYELKPGSAQLHFFRALLLWQGLPTEFRAQAEDWSSDDAPQPTLSELEPAVNTLQNVFEELHLLAISEDTKWDHRLRDLRGPAMFAYLLPDVQQARSLARILRLKIRLQNLQGDTDGMIESLRDGFRLAAFVGQGETLVQQLVGMAIQSMMLHEIEELIQLPNAPNMYWPLATLPRPLIRVHESIQFELSGIHRVLPVLAQAENEQHEEAYWIAQWAKLIEDYKELGGSNENEKLALAIFGAASVAPAKERLIAAGMDASKVEALPGLQVVLWDASREIRGIADDLAKATYLPDTLGRQVAAAEFKVFEQWVTENKFKSIAAVIAGLLFPAVQAAESASTRQEYFVNRLMTIEALRLHAATHAGQLPPTLEQLDPVPALPNPFNGQAFQYTLSSKDQIQMATIAAELPYALDSFKEIRVRFEN